MVLQKGGEKEERFVSDIIKISAVLWPTQSCAVTAKRGGEPPVCNCTYCCSTTWEQIPKKWSMTDFSISYWSGWWKKEENYPGGDSDAVSDGGGSLEKTISLVRKEGFLGSQSEADRQHTLRYHNTQAPPTHTHCSLSANYAACNEGVKWVVTQKHQEKQEDADSLVKRSLCEGRCHWGCWVQPQVAAFTPQF